MVETKRGLRSTRVFAWSTRLGHPLAYIGRFAEAVHARFTVKGIGKDINGPTATGDRITELRLVITLLDT
jgi:hypothetical protein